MTLTGLVSLLVGCFDGGGLLLWTHSSQPITVEVGKVVTGSSCTLALYDRMSSEILEAAARRGQRLATTSVAGPCVLRTGSQQVDIHGELIAFYLSSTQLSFFKLHSPGRKSNPSTDSSSQVDRWGLCDPGYEKPPRVKLSHTRRSG